MELEFDKEIDALLRRKLNDSPPAARAPAGDHLDADQMAALAENALPDRTRSMYVSHLADCNRCRIMLSNIAAIYPGEASHAASAASAFAPAPSGEQHWFRRLFALPNLAYTMGALVLVFSGMLGYLVVQDRMSGNTTEMSQVTSSEPQAGGPSFNDGSETASNAISAANSASSSANSNSAANAATNITRSGVANTAVANAPVGEVAADTAAQPAAGAPLSAAAPPAKDAVVTEDRDEKLNKPKEENPILDGLEKKRSDDLRALREAPKTGPSRAAGPRNQQQNVQDSNLSARQIEALPTAKAAPLSNVRTGGGKKFEQRDGVWFDTDYRGQGTKSVRRGTEDYIRLDGGLRSIADSIGGTVVIVWKGKAYRIQ